MLDLMFIASAIIASRAASALNSSGEASPSRIPFGKRSASASFKVILLTSRAPVLRTLSSSLFGRETKADADIANVLTMDEGEQYR